MKHRLFKRIGTMFLALTMLMTMGTAASSVFAAEQDASDVLTVYNVEQGATVKAYKIVKEENGKWVKSANSLSIADPAKPTAKEIAAIASSSDTLAALTSVDLTYNAADKSFKAAQKQTPGVYLVLVTGTNGATLYNPMIVSIDYDGTLDSVDASKNFEYDGSVAYAKSSTPKIDKSNDKKGNTASGTTDKGTSAQVGDEVGFTLKTTIPSYSEQYTNVTFNVSDTLDAGLDVPKASDIKVTVGGNDVAASADTYTVTLKDRGFEIAFASDYIKGLAAKTAAERAVVVKYTSKVNENATYNYIPNKNTAEITFTNKPDGSTGKDTDNSKIYTFGLDANLNGTATTKNKKTHEVIKLDENGQSQTLSYNEDGTETTVTNPLAGAVFKLYSDEACKNEVAGATTSTNGYMEMTGLKEGTYYLKEISAPSGYVPSDTVFTVTISATYDEDGTLLTHTVNIADGDTSYGSTYTATYASDGSIDNITAESETLFIVNSKVPGLPSTGGIGTYIFTIIGVVIMSMAAILLRKRYKAAKNAQ